MLRKRTIPVRFKGLNTKVGRQLLPQGEFLDLVNVRKSKAGEWKKRDGFTSLSSASSVGKLLANYNDQLVMFDDESNYSYSGDQSDWFQNSGTFFVDRFSSEELVKNQYSQYNFDISVASNLICVSYLEKGLSDQIISRIYDETSLTLIHEEVLDASGAVGSTKVIALSDRFLIFHADGSNFYVNEVTFADPTSFSSTVLQSGSYSADTLDVDLYDSSNVVYCVHDGTDLEVGIVDTTGPTVSDSTTVSHSTPDAAAIFSDSTAQEIYLGHLDSGASSLDLVGFDFNNLTTSETASVSGSWSSVTSLVGYVLDSTTRGFYFAVDTFGNQVLYRFEVENAVGSFTSLGFNTRGVYVSMVSKANVTSNGIYFWAVFKNFPQTTYFLVRDDLDESSSDELRAVSVLNQGVGTGLTTDINDSNIKTVPNYVTSGSKSYTLFSVKNKLVGEDSFAAADTQNLFLCDSENGVDISNGVQFGRTLYYVAGNTLFCFDGKVNTEAGFFHYPMDVIRRSESGTGGNYTNGEVYSWVVVYEWVNNAGEIFRSAPSVSTSKTLSSDATQVDVDSGGLVLGNKYIDSTYKAVLYRTTGNGTLYYRSQEEIKTESDSVFDFTDDTDDADLPDNEILYTTGGVLDNVFPPPCSFVVKHGDRLFVNDLNDGNSLNYTKLKQPGIGAEFNDTLKLRVEEGVGDVSAAGSLDDKLVIFKPNSTHVVVGDGPNNLGLNNSFSQPEQLPGPHGCEEPRSVIEVTNGLMFKSKKGFYLLDRGLNFNYVGARVEDFNDETVTSAVQLEDSSEVRFTTESGRCLVYNYYFDQWTTFDNYSAVSAVEHSDIYYHLKSDGTVNKETPGVYTDNGSTIQMTLETSWLTFADLQGFQRVYYTHFLGEHESDHTAQVEIAYDYSTSYNETKTLDTSTIGDDVWQFRIKPQIQKCQAIKFRIRDLDNIINGGSGGGASFSLTGISFEIGIKRTNVKLRPSRTI